TDRDADVSRETDSDAVREADREADTTVVPDNQDAPDRASRLGARAWWGVLKRTAKEFSDDNLTDWSAALTYYAILSIFPGIVVLVSAFSLLADRTEEAVIDNLKSIAPGSIAAPLNSFLNDLHNSQHT